MPAPRGSRNAALYQQRLMDHTASRVELALSALKKSGDLFRNITNLSRQVSGQIGISDVSLRRNERYRAMLDEYLVSQKGAASILSPLHQDLTFLRSKIKMLQLENANKEQKIRRLELALSKVGLPEPIVEAPLNCNIGGWTSHFIQTANLVLALVDWGDLKLDAEMQSIVDDYAPPGSDVIANVNLAGPFFEWLADQEKGS